MINLLKLRTRLCFVTLISALSTACGGGGGGGGGGNQPPPAPVNQTPTASFTLSATTGDAPFNVTVDASASSDSDGQILSYEWDFAGTPGLGTVAQHTFNDPGTFTVALTVTDNEGAAGYDQPLGHGKRKHGKRHLERHRAHLEFHRG